MLQVSEGVHGQLVENVTAAGAHRIGGVRQREAGVNRHAKFVPRHRRHALDQVPTRPTGRADDLVFLRVERRDVGKPGLGERAGQRATD